MGSINVCLARKGRGGCEVKPVLGVCLVEANLLLAIFVNFNCFSLNIVCKYCVINFNGNYRTVLKRKKIFSLP